MTTHRIHPTPGDPAGTVLFNDCARCDEHSFEPWNSLDDTHLYALVSKPPQSVPELRAIARMKEAIQVAARLRELHVEEILAGVRVDNRPESDHLRRIGEESGVSEVYCCGYWTAVPGQCPGCGSTFEIGE
jgi:hypothetical protein